jgi:GMP synthase-like glutamine amidotransferase
MRAVAILRFSPTEGPAYFADWLEAHGVPWTLVPIDAGAGVPDDPRAFAGIGMMGGPMSVNDPLSWIEPLCGMLRTAVAADVPVIGHCLGGQLLARALGAPVARSPNPEVGWGEVEAAAPDAAAEWFGGRTRMQTFQWHYESFALPDGATRVLTNRHNANQAYVLGDRHVGLQCHFEMTPALVASWLETGAKELPAASIRAVQSAADIAADLDARIAALHAVADDLYARWARGLRR